MKVQSNSPLRSVPDDYCPEGSAKWFEIPGGYDAGKRLFYYDFTIGNQAPDATVLFVHGNPECSYTYRHARDVLVNSGANLRIVAADNIGFGVSDQATYEMVDRHHAANLKHLIEMLDLKDVILVVHDWGGPIGVGAFLGEMDRVSGLVVANSTIFPMPTGGMTYSNGPIPWMPWRYFPFIVPDSAWGGLAATILRNSNPGSNIGLLLRSVRTMLRFVLHQIPPGTADYVFSESLRSKVNARSSKRNVLQTPAWGYGYTYEDARFGVQTNYAFYEEMQEQVPLQWGANGRNIPAAGHFGRWDPCGKESVICQWQKAIPRITEDLHSYPGIGHFVEEEKGPEIAASILAIASSGASANPGRAF